MRLRVLTVLLLLAGRAAAAAEPVSPVRYRIEARVDGPEIRGRTEIEIDPPPDAPIEDVVLFLFPNLLSERLHGENSKSFYTIHPARFEAGGMELLALEGEDGTPLPFAGVDVDRPDGHGGRVPLPSMIAVRAALPLPATTTVRLRAEFRVRVPVRFGTFSWYRNDLLVNNGWFPLVAGRGADGRWDLSADLPRADVSLRLDVDDDRWAVVDGTVHPPAAGRAAIAHATRSRSGVMLLVADRLHRRERDGVVLLSPTPPKSYEERILEVASKARRSLVQRGLLREDAPPVTLYEAPLTRELVFHDAPTGLLSSRIYRVFPPMRRYHDLHVARAAIAASMREAVYAGEPGADAGWVLDAVTWYLARAWASTTYGELRDVREYARPLSFLPAVDLVLYTPDFPFFAEYYDNRFFTDLLRDDASRFNHLRPNGRVAYDKLVDLSGTVEASRAMWAYLRGLPAGEGFRATVERELDRDLGWFFDQWRAPLPSVNYVLRSVTTRRAPDGTWISTVGLAREGDAIAEPVRVQAIAPGADARVTWNSDEGAGELQLTTARRPLAIELDPNGRLIETDRRDNRIPPVWRLLLHYAYVDYEFKLNTIDAGFSVQVERSNDLRNQIDVVGFRRQQSTGAALGYIRSAGRFTYYRGLLHRLGFYLLAEDLETRYAREGLHVVPGFDPEISRVDSTLGVVAAYRYDSRDDWRFSRRGTRFYAGIEAGTSLDERLDVYRLASAEVVHQKRLSDNNVLALQLKAGTFLATDPAAVPLSKLFYLGGIEDVRGISAPEIVGPTKFLVGAEWRHYWLHDLDLNFYVERMRGLQGVLFVDSGFIAPRLGDVPALPRWVTSVGYGFREHYDFLGVRPMVFRLDLAQRIDDLARTGKPDLRLYIGAGQSF